MSQTAKIENSTYNILIALGKEADSMTCTITGGEDDMREMR